MRFSNLGAHRPGPSHERGRKNECGKGVTLPDARKALVLAYVNASSLANELSNSA